MTQLERVRTDPRPGDVAKYRPEAPEATVLSVDGDVIRYELAGHGRRKCDRAWWKLFSEIVVREGR